MNHPRVLFVDDDDIVLAGLKRTLVGLPLEMVFERNPVRALERVATEPYDLVVSDQRMPGVTGVELLEVVSRTQESSVRLLLTGHADLQIAMAAINRCRVQGLLTKPWDVRHLRDTVLSSARAAHLSRLATAKSSGEGLPAAVAAIVSALEVKNPGARRHCEVVAVYGVAIAEVLGLSEADQESIRNGGLLHDCGKIALPERLLEDVDFIGSDEYALVKTHPEIGYRMVTTIEMIAPASRDIILHHHERWDGMGYPHGLEGEAVNLPARIIAVADTCENMTRAQISRGQSDPTRLIEELTRQADNQFDPEIARIARQLVESGRFAVLRAGTSRFDPADDH